jgi:hypothetical protein
VKALEGKTLRTLDRRKPFDVLAVLEDAIVLKVSTGKTRSVPRQEIEGAFRELVKVGSISRPRIQKRHSSRSTAYVAAILTHLKGVTHRTHPIQLSYRAVGKPARSPVPAAMTVVNVVELIRDKLSKTRGPAKVPLLRGKNAFTAELTEGGITVSNLPSQPFLPWAAFQEAVCALIRQGGRAKRGNAMHAKLGELELPLDSVEGHVALTVYGKRPGDSVFRRITPIACILIWSGICKAAPGELVLRDSA